MKTVIGSLLALLVFCSTSLIAQAKSEATKLDDEASVQESERTGQEVKATEHGVVREDQMRKVTRISNTQKPEQSVKYDAKGGVVVPGASKGIPVGAPASKERSAVRPISTPEKVQKSPEPVKKAKDE